MGINNYIIVPILKTYHACTVREHFGALFYLVSTNSMLREE